MFERSFHIKLWSCEAIYLSHFPKYTQNIILVFFFFLVYNLLESDCLNNLEQIIVVLEFLTPSNI